MDDSDREIQVNATQAKRELKPILGADSQSLEGTFKHTGSVRSRGKESKYLRAKNTRTLVL